MRQNMLNYNLYIRNILKAIEKIERTCKNRDSLNNEDIWDMTLMRLQIIGENSIMIPKEIKKKYSKIKWMNIKKLRNIISHRYEEVDKELLWKFIEKKMLELKNVALEIKHNLENEEK